MSINPAGIYAITHAATGRAYVGSAVNVGRRWNAHKSHLSRGCHANPLLQNGWNKHGAGAFTFSILEPVADRADLIAREQAWMDATAPFYNIRKVAESNLGIVLSAKARANMSASRLGKKKGPFSAAHRANMSAAGRGRVHSAESRANMGAAQIGRKHSEESRAKMSAARRGRAHSAEHGAKIAAALRGHVCSAETRAKISATKRRVHWTHATAQEAA